MNTEKLGRTKTFEIKESYEVEGITEDFIWYNSKILKNKMSSWEYEFERIVNVMESRHKEHLEIINDLMRENNFLRSKVKEK
jgi:hypothetical protein